MRKIKFRAWTGNRMIDFKEVCDMHATPWNSTSLKWLQYTGLKDKNGKEIYEGDIVAWRYIGDKKGVVKYNLAHFWVDDFYAPNFDNPSDAFGEGIGMLEVIGNIYENPELLK